jgi:flagellar hook-associated protein 3 FlgL
MPVTAADPDLRDVLTGYALAALVAEGTLAAAPEERAALVREAGIRIMSGDAALARAGARIGGAEAALEDAEAARAAERTALEQARDALKGADPYRTATALTAAQTQLETLYALTARLSGLSLAEYLK